jgi:nicotinate-nucleotide--dimethylbenzimidazole phosphoribosyltransferase
MTGIASPSPSARAAASERQLQLTKPTGALGRLEDASIWMSGVQDSCPPVPFAHPRLVIFAGDHGVARAAGTSAYPPEVTAQMVANFVAGGAAANVIARQVGATVRVVDVSVDCDPAYLDPIDPTVAARRVQRGSGSVDREDAMSSEIARTAFDLGALIADEEIAAGADVLIAGDMGIGNTTPAAALIAACTGAVAADVTGRGTGVDDDTLARKATAISNCIARAGGARGLDLIARIGSPDIAAMTGYLVRASELGVPVVLDGIVSCSAALVAEQIAPGACAWWAAGHVSTEPAAARALEALGLKPLLSLDLRLGEGTGALLALPLLASAAATLGEMATFASAGVSDRDA